MGSPPATKKRKADKVAKSPIKKHQSPQKKRTVSIRVEVTPNNPEYDPVVVSFPRGVPSSITRLDSGDATAGDDLPRFTSSKLDASSSRGRRIAGQDDTCTYTASAAGRGHDGRLTKAYVCIYDKKKKTLRMVPAAEKGTIFALEQAVKAYTPNVAHGSMLIGGGQTQHGDDGEGGKAKSVMSASDRVTMLVDSFGSKAKQKVMASRAANKVNIHSVVGSGAVLLKSVTKQEGISLENKKGMEDGSKMANPNDAAQEQARKKMLPPYDLNADSPAKVYDAQKIAGDAAWSKASRIVDRVLEKKSEGIESDWIDALLGTKGNRPESIVMLLKSIDMSKKSASYRIKVAFFLFLSLKFQYKIQRNNRGIIEGTSLDDCISGLHIPHEVGVRLLELFTSEAIGGKEHTGYIVSKQQRHKLNSHLLILYVIANGKKMKVPSINQLCKDMKLDAKEATLVLRAAGFVVKKNGTGDVGASLTVPLTFPAPMRGKRT